ncbi:DUF2939 domain-containing protein [Rhodoplanes serenus]|uniref:DUF2939 domain-containing protein n=1 Tax=Rhodoplanes serenus TaxID=200615 RepID=UPI000DADA0B0|nr:DUF2939 domain-containing protein [Rhodoplanes serenus]RAI35884.1 hypothetical protein CH340_04630 [Rhodoplanes serenus]
MKKLLAVFFGLAILWIAWPYYVAYELARAVEAGDPVTIERRVDWTTLRQGLREELNTMFLAHLAKNARGESDALGQGIAALVGPALIDRAVDAYANPKAIAALVERGRAVALDQSATASDSLSAAGAPEPRKIDLKNVRYAFFTGNPFTFKIEVVPQGEGVTSPAILLFKWSGDWQLVRLFLPTVADPEEVVLNRFRAKAVPPAPAAVAEPPPVVTIGKQPTQAVLYEEDPKSPAGKRFEGTAVWRSEEVTASGQPRRYVAGVEIDIPGNKVRVRATFQRNTDSSLPASHTIEVRFELPPNFARGETSNVPGLLMKDAEKTRGKPLAGLAVKVAKDSYLIGLSATPTDVQGNVEQLRSGKWLDIPIVYSDRRRAILAVELGADGGLAIDRVLQAGVAQTK